MAKESLALESLTGKEAEEVPFFQPKLKSPKIPLSYKLGRLPVVRQQSLSDCGVACLCTVARYYGKYISPNILREQAKVGRRGSSLFHMMDVAEKYLSFHTEAIQATYEHLMNSHLPAIINWEGYHWVVLYKLTPTKAVFADPAEGMIREVSKEEFLKKWTRYTLYLSPSDQFGQLEESKPTFQNFRGYVRPYYRLLTEVFIASLAIQVMSIFLPVSTKFILDEVIIKQNMNWLYPLLAGTGAVVVLNLLLSFFRQNLLLFVIMKMNLLLVSDFYKHMISLPISFFLNRKVGDVTSRFQENEKITSFMTEVGTQSFLDLITATLYLCIMFYYNAALTWVSLSFISLHVGIIYFVTPHLQNAYRDAFQKGADNESHLIESLRGYSTIKNLAIENPIRWEWEDLYSKHSNSYFKTLRYGILTNLASGVVNHFSESIILFYGAFMVMHNKLSVGELVAFLAFAKGVSGPLQKLVGIWDLLQESLNSVERLSDVFEKPSEFHDEEEDKLKPRLQGHVALEDLTFRYSSDGRNTLQNINLSIEPGMHVAFVGKSGSGKSTLFKLLAGFHQPASGKVMFDGFDIKELYLPSLRQQLGMVLQSPYLFDGTIRDNIAKAVPDASFFDIVEASKVACAHEFISGFPYGYNTQIDSYGANLSGGQAQRLMLARMILQHPKVLILDEATSSLDLETERQVLKNLKERFPESTVLIAAHRLPTIQHADKIVVIDKGIVLETGNHDELIANKSLYYHLWLHYGSVGDAS